MKEQKGITLVALVITIIILIILAGISIASLTNSGLFNRAQEAKNASENGMVNENTSLNEFENYMTNYLGE